GFEEADGGLIDGACLGDRRDVAHGDAGARQGEDLARDGAAEREPAREEVVDAEAEACVEAVHVDAVAEAADGVVESAERRIARREDDERLDAAERRAEAELAV